MSRGHVFAKAVSHLRKANVRKVPHTNHPFAPPTVVSPAAAPQVRSQSEVSCAARSLIVGSTAHHSRYGVATLLNRARPGPYCKGQKNSRAGLNTVWFVEHPRFLQSRGDATGVQI